MSTPSLTARLLARRRLIFGLAGLLSLSGALAWGTMPRQEDPPLEARFGVIVAPFPGADAETIERLVADPIESELAQIADIREVVSTSRADVAVLRVQLRDAVTDMDASWDEVRAALDAATAALPEGAATPSLDADIGVDQELVVLAVTGSLDPLALLNGARALRRGLLRVPGVARVRLHGDPGEQILVELDESQGRALGLSTGAVAEAIRGANASLPAGRLALGGRSAPLRADTDLDSLQALAAIAVPLPGGVSVPLSELARVRHGPAEPTPVRVRHDGRPAVVVAVVPQPELDVVELGRALRAAVSEIGPTLGGLDVEELSFQPDFVESRLDELGRSLLLGILIVAAVLVAAMGVRLGLVVSAVVPLVALSALAAYAMGGGILHQISIAALIIALGMLVDNAIVVAEEVQRRIDDGEAPGDAASETVRGLALPLATATGTTLAAFVPMLLSTGPTADFTRAIPIVIMLTLTISYAFAALVTPALASLLLVRRAGARDPARDARLRRLAQLAVRHPGLVLGLAALLVAGSAALSGRVDRSFFPAAGRAQLVVEVLHPEGSHLDTTDATVAALEAALAGDPRVLSVSSFVGRSAPRFYYNLPNRPSSPHFAHLLVRTTSPAEVSGVADGLRAIARRLGDGAEIVPRPLEQGPPIAAPIELRLHGASLEALFAAAETTMQTLRAVPGARDVTHDLGLGVPSISVAVDGAAARRQALSPRDVGVELLARTRGLPAGHLRSGLEPVPILVRAPAGERLSPDRVDTLSIPSREHGPVPVAQLSRTEVRWRPAAIHRRDRVREVSVTAQLEDGASYGKVLETFRARSGALPAGVHLEVGGAARGSGDANLALLRAAPIGGLLLLLCLLLEFDSLRRVGLILSTVPLAAAGVVPGLVVADAPFGFMSMLGVIALVGVVVNNAIVLIDLVERERERGAAVEAAVIEAVRLRTRPILLTSLTTVAGLLPLALSDSPLWPPLASAMIAGLLASTFLTLGVVPAAYVLLFEPRRRGPLDGRAVPVLSALALALLVAAPGAASAAERPSLSEALRRGAEQPSSLAAEASAGAAAAEARAVWRQRFLPSLGVEASVGGVDRQLSLVTPVGSFPFGRRTAARVGAQLTQPLLDLPGVLGTAPAASGRAEAAELVARRARQSAAAEAAGRWLDARAAEAGLEAQTAFVAALEARAAQIARLAEHGRALEIDALRIELALAEARQERLDLDAHVAVARRALGEALGAAGPVAPGALDLDVSAPAAAASVDASIDAALGRRAELAALDASTAAREAERRAVWWSLAPRLEARGRLVYDSGLPYDTDHYLEAQLVAVWTPMEAGTRPARADALDADAARLRAERDQAERGIRLEVEAAHASLEAARGSERLATTAVEQARRTVDVERTRYEEGLLTLSDLLEAEALLRRQRVRRALAELSVARAWIALRHATGALDRAPARGQEAAAHCGSDVRQTSCP